MFDFIPENKKAAQVPYFEDASHDEGWQFCGREIAAQQARAVDCQPSQNLEV